MRQHGKSLMNPAEKIQDMLISVAVLLDSTGPSSFEKLSETAARLADSYRFIDFLIVGDVRCEFDEKAFARVVALCPQSRYLQIEGAFGYDDLIRFACGEVIGDIVVFASVDEIDKVDVLHLLSVLRQGPNMVRLRRNRAPMLELAAARVLKLVTGFDVDPRFLRTIGVNRSLLGQLLNQPSLLSFVRFRAATFEPNHEVIDVDVAAPRRGLRALIGRLEVIANLIGIAAPRLLSFAAALSGLLALMSLAYMLYVGVVLLVKPHVAEGWTTLSLVIAFGLFVQTTALAIICLGVARLFRDQDPQKVGRILNDVSSSDLFRSFTALNIERS
jgi:hypothetical protein